MEINLLNKITEEEVIIEEKNSNPFALIIITIIVVSSSVFALIKLFNKSKKENY